MIITNPRTRRSDVVDNAKHCCCTEINGNGKIYHNNYRIFAQRQDCQNNQQEEFWNHVDLQKAEEQLNELILSFHLSGIYHSYVKLLEGSNQVPLTVQSQQDNHPVEGSNQEPLTVQSQHVDERTAGTMNINVWNRIQSTPIFATFFGCFSRHRPVTRNKGRYHTYNSLSMAFSLIGLS